MVYFRISVGDVTPDITELQAECKFHLEVALPS